MVDTLTESFCERCGTRYSFDPPKPRSGTLSNVKVLGKGIRRLALTRAASLDEALASARADEQRAQAEQLQEAFHGAFHLCLSCRQYTCSSCWNDESGTCLTCNPTPESQAAEAEAAEAAAREEEQRQAEARAAAAAAEAHAQLEADAAAAAAEAHAQLEADAAAAAGPGSDSAGQGPEPVSSAAPDTISDEHSATASWAPADGPDKVKAQQLDGLMPGTSLDDFIAAYEATAGHSRPVEGLNPAIGDGAGTPGPTPSIPDRPNWLLGRARPLEADEDEAGPPLADLSALFRERPALAPDQLSATPEPREPAEVEASGQSIVVDGAGHESPAGNETPAATQPEPVRAADAIVDAAAASDGAVEWTAIDPVIEPPAAPRLSTAESEPRTPGEPKVQIPEWLQDAVRTPAPPEPAMPIADRPAAHPWAATAGPSEPDQSPPAPWQLTAPADPEPDRTGEDPRIAAWRTVAPEIGGASPAVPAPPAIPPSFAARMGTTAGPAAEPGSAPAPITSGARACGGCGLSLSANARFCRRCGTRQS